MIDNRKRLYWSLQFAGWVSYFTLCAVLMLLINHQLRGLLAWFFIMVGHMAASHLLRHVIRTRNWLALPPGALAGRILPACIGLALAVNLVLAPIPPLIGMNSLAEQFSMFRYFVPYSFFLFAVWSLIYVAFQYFFRYRDSEMKRLRLEASINEAELRALKAQVNPHFLFNCLNNLRALITEDSEKAREMLLRLSELLRYSLEAGRRDKVTLAEELRIVDGYLALEKMQLEERLAWRFDIAQSAMTLSIPPMLVQQLVENAIKHGIAPAKSGGEILVWVRDSKSRMEVRVENTGSLKENAGKGFGIENVRERLRLLCGTAASFDLQNVGEGRVAATAHIPVAA